MPLLKTSQFGPIEYDPQAVVDFPWGLPAFEQEKRFVLIEQPDWRPLVFLNSLDTEDLCFIALPATRIDPSYAPAIPEEDYLRLETSAGEAHDLLALAILAAGEDGELTANLLAPVLVNYRNRRGIQVIQSGSRYSHRHPLRPAAEASPCC